nr:putative reverse transcriptase domain-containing protein [Tanacetum cinerariifolium]
MSWYMISGDANSWNGNVLHIFTVIFHNCPLFEILAHRLGFLQTYKLTNIIVDLFEYHFQVCCEPRFEESVKNHFGPSKYEDLNEVLSKLLQLGTRELLVSKPTTLGDVFLLARTIKDRFDDQAALVVGTSAGLEANKVVNDGDDSESLESTSDNDARDQAGKLETKMLVEGKQDEAKVVVVADEQNSDEPDVLEGNGVIVLSLSPMFDSQDLFPSKEISPKDTETPVESPIPVPPSSSPVSIAAALETQAANMENTNNTNRNTGTSRTPVARKGTNDHKRKFIDRRNTTTNNDKNYSNNRNNNYQDNHNNHNRNNDYHQQQNKRQDKKYHGNLPLCTRCTLHHIRVCTIRCQTCNKVGHRTRNCKSKGPATGSNLRSVSITCYTCGEKGHYKRQCSKTDNNTFHVSKKYLCDESHVIPMKEIWLDDKLNFVEEPVEIMDREVKQLRQKCIPIVKVRCSSEFTWEHEDQIRAKYPHLFPNNTLSSN